MNVSNQVFGPLYKRTATGAIQQWMIECENNKYHSISGQVNGQMVTSEWTICNGKNIGRSNETTPEEQAEKEAYAKYIKKLDEHYFSDLSSVDGDRYPEAMLAHKYPKAFDGDFSDVYSQPKLDGMRCLINKTGMWSRGGKPIVSAPHIHESLKSMFDLDPTLVLDGELYTDALKDDFNKIISLAKKSKPTAKNLIESAEKLEYWVYDTIRVGGFYGRNTYIKGLLADVSNIVIVPTTKVHNQEELDQLYGDYLANGMEGQMIRKGDSSYEGKRSKSLLKRKEFQDAEYTVVSLNEGKGNYSGMIKSVSLITDEGKQFDAGIKGNQEYLRNLMTWPSGGDATVRFQNLTPDGIPRFGVVYHLWEGKRDV